MTYHTLPKSVLPPLSPTPKNAPLFSLIAISTVNGS